MSKHELTTVLATLTAQINILQESLPVLLTIYAKAVNAEIIEPCFKDRQIEIMEHIGDSMQSQIQRVKNLCNS
jgi:hypothetical protein